MSTIARIKQDIVYNVELIHCSTELHTFLSNFQNRIFCLKFCIPATLSLIELVFSTIVVYKYMFIHTELE